MKTLSESLLSTDFDINIEPVELPKFHAERIPDVFERDMEQCNPILKLWPKYAKLKEALKDFADHADELDVASGRGMKIFATTCKNLANDIAHNKVWTDGDLDRAASWAENVRRILPHIIKVDEIGHKLCKIYDKEAWWVNIDNRKYIGFYFLPRTISEDEATEIYRKVGEAAQKAGVPVEYNDVCLKIRYMA